MPLKSLAPPYLIVTEHLDFVRELFEFFNVVFFATTQGQEDEGEGVQLFGVQKVFVLTGFETAVPKQRETLACHT
jgi:hypothetical protein